ncbi:unnamed protein product [Durusdinium trenchii]|uniref:Uncharacterized protein n=1 Tax=Durusdinium trenchii TaxID=1381693 RepID=A0ABP0NK67_9DINO
MPIQMARNNWEKESDAYTGIGYLVCSKNNLLASTSTCECNAASCQTAGCAVTTGALLEKSGRVGVAYPPVPMESGRSTSFSCEALPGFTGTATGTCTSGVYSADVSGCTPKPCTPTDAPKPLKVGSVAFDVVAPSEVRSGRSWNLNCAGINPKYEGTVTATCRFGAVELDNGCYEAPCNDTQRMITLTNSYQMSISLTGPTFGFDTRTPSSYNNTIVSCGAFNSSIDGTASVTCIMGDYTLDASGCGPRGCPLGSSYLAQLGSREISTTLEEALVSEESTSRTCASVLPGWTGTFGVRCSYGKITGDGSGCAPGSCASGDIATIVIGGTAMQTTISSNMASFDSVTRNCSTVDTAYEGEFSLTCEAAVLFGNTSGCNPKPVAGSTVEARQVVESAVAFTLPAVSATVEEMQAVMDSDASKRAYEMTLSDSLEVPLEDVTVFSIQVYDANAARRLQEVNKTNLQVNVNFQLRTKGTAANQDAQVNSLKTKIENLGSSGSSEQQVFQESLAKNLEEAAKVDPENLALLDSTAQATAQRRFSS